MQWYGSGTLICSTKRKERLGSLGNQWNRWRWKPVAWLYHHKWSGLFIRLQHHPRRNCSTSPEKESNNIEVTKGSYLPCWTKNNQWQPALVAEFCNNVPPDRLWGWFCSDLINWRTFVVQLKASGDYTIWLNGFFSCLTKGKQAKGIVQKISWSKGSEKSFIGAHFLARHLDVILGSSIGFFEFDSTIRSVFCLIMVV